MIRLKDDSIELQSLHPALGMALTGTVAPMFDDIGKAVEITSGCERDGSHMTGSLHYVGAAVDVSTARQGITLAQAESVATALRDALKGDFDIVVYDTHMHIEYQPK